MARKKQEIALQLEINTQEEWEELMQKDGLLIVDVYQDWCGPCKALLSFLRRMKNEIGDDLLQFAIAKVDTIDSLDKYRGRCEPCFLIYGGGALVSVIRGANPPALEETIKSKLEEEHKVMKGEIERKEIKDPYLTDIDVEEKVEKFDSDIEEIEQEVTLALIKPDVVKAEKVEEILIKIKERGIEILAKEERNLSEDEAKSFYHHMENSEFFDNLIKFITSGPSYILVLAKGDEGIIREFKELIGPKVFEEAKETAPESFRATYGTNSIENAIHGADDKESVQRELAFFFPDFVVPKIARKKQEVSHQQRTLALIRPAAFVEFRESILEKIKMAGFKISMQKEVKLNKEDAELFYKDHKRKPYFDDLTTEMSNGTLLALALEKQNAISGFRGMLGPKDVEQAKENDPSSLRAQFSKEDVAINLIHGSDSEETALNELKYFFPIEHTIAAIKPDGIENREEIINRIMEAQFNIVMTLDIVMTKELADEFYSDQRDQEYFDDLITHIQSGPTLFMILSREDAIRGWRSIMGPKDPNIAADSYPDSIRSVYGKDIKENAVFGSSDEGEVSRVMELIFGKLEFNEDGTVQHTEEENASNEKVEDKENKEEPTADDPQDNSQMDSSDNKDENEGDTLTKEEDYKDAEEPEVAEPSFLKDQEEKTTIDKDNKESNLEETTNIKHESEDGTNERTENIEELNEKPDKDQEEKTTIDKDNKESILEETTNIKHESEDGTNERTKNIEELNEKPDKDISSSHDDDMLGPMETGGIDVEEEIVEGSKVDETLIEDSSEVNNTKVDEKIDIDREITVEESQEQNEVTEAEVIEETEHSEQETDLEKTTTKEDKNINAEEMTISEGHKEKTTGEEIIVSKEVEETVEDSHCEDETLFEEIDLGSKSEITVLNEDTAEENIIEETVVDENPGEGTVTDDNLVVEIAQSEDVNNAGTDAPPAEDL